MAIFRDPAARLPVGEHPRNIILPLHDDDIDQAVKAVRNPRDRLVLALAAIHAARPKRFASSSSTTSTSATGG